MEDALVMLDGPAHMRAPVFMAHNRSAVGRASPRLTINEIGAGAKHCLLGGRISRQPMPRPISPFGDVDLASKSYALTRSRRRGRFRWRTSVSPPGRSWRGGGVAAGHDSGAGGTVYRPEILHISS